MMERKGEKSVMLRDVIDDRGRFCALHTSDVSWRGRGGVRAEKMEDELEEGVEEMSAGRERGLLITLPQNTEQQNPSQATDDDDKHFVTLASLSLLSCYDSIQDVFEAFVRCSLSYTSFLPLNDLRACHSRRQKLPGLAHRHTARGQSSGQQPHRGRPHPPVVSGRRREWPRPRPGLPAARCSRWQAWRLFCLGDRAPYN